MVDAVQKLEPIFDWTITVKIFRSASFLRKEAAAESKKLVDSMFRTVRDLALGLRPSMLDDFGLHAALEWYVRDVINRYGLNVTDDGIGFDSTRRHAGLGLRGIEERVKELQGVVTIETTDAGGTKLAIRLPWRTPSAEVPLARAAG